MNKPIVKIKLLPGGKMPERMSKGAAAWDCFAREDVLVGEEPRIIGLGFVAEPPDGYYLKILPRSSIGANTPLRMPNKQDIIDGDYRGEVKAVYECKLHTMFECSGTRLGFGPYQIKAGDRIAQMMLCKVEDADLVEIDELSETERGDGGFGSTGR